MPKLMTTIQAIREYLRPVQYPRCMEQKGNTVCRDLRSWR